MGQQYSSLKNIQSLKNGQSISDPYCSICCGIEMVGFMTTEDGIFSERFIWPNYVCKFGTCLTGFDDR